MTRISPLSLDQLDADTQAMIDYAQSTMGFVPNDALIMARQPPLIKAMGGLVAAVYGPGEVDSGLKRLVGEATSKAAGCVYCSAMRPMAPGNAVSAKRRSRPFGPLRTVPYSAMQNARLSISA